MAQGAVVEVVAPKLGNIISENNKEIKADKSFLTSASVLYDAVYIPGGPNSVATLEAEPDAIHFLNEAFKHCKALAADASALSVLQATYFGSKIPDNLQKMSQALEGVLINETPEALANDFISAISKHRFWQREKKNKVPA